MYMVNNIFTPSRYKEIIMVQPKPSAGLKGKPHQHALIFMPSCIKKSKAWIPRPKSYFGIYPNFHKLSTHTKNGNHICTNQIYKQYSKTYAQMPLRYLPSTWWAHFWVQTARGWGQCGLPHHFRTQSRPKAIPSNPLIQ